MPRGDRTGPMGMGPLTGRGAGYCVGAGVPGYANPVAGRGFGLGGGRMGSGRGVGGGGRGRRNMYYATGLPGWRRFGGYAQPFPEVNAETERQALRNEARALQSELDQIKKRLAEFETETK